MIPVCSWWCDVRNHPVFIVVLAALVAACFFCVIDGR